jgi:hypothetical protein
MKCGSWESPAVANKAEIRGARACVCVWCGASQFSGERPPAAERSAEPAAVAALGRGAVK